MSDCEIWSGRGLRWSGKRGSETWRRECKRLLAEKLGRPIRRGYQANHYCDNKSGPCISTEPGHLYEGTKEQNALDAIRNGLVDTKLFSGPKNGMSKLTTEQVRSIREDLIARRMIVFIAQKYGVRPSSIRRIRDGIAYKNVE